MSRRTAPWMTLFIEIDSAMPATLASDAAARARNYACDLL
jgi:hypothetical protein